MIKKQWFVFTVLVTALCFNSSVFSQTIIYVDSSATGLNNGQSWQNAYKNLDSAIVHASGFTANDSIKIAKGTYRPSHIPGGVSTGDARDVAFYISFNGILSGGYSPGGTVLNHYIYPTILSGDIGVKGDSLDNTYHVLVVKSPSVKIDGLTITGGNANGADSLQTGTGNIPRFNGGGIYFMNGAANLQEIIAESNYGFYGGAFYNNASTLTMTNAVFGYNSASRGGALYNSPSSTCNLNNVVAFGNFADDMGGAIVDDNANQYVFDNCTFVQNFVNINFAGAIYNIMSSATSTINNSLFSGNYIFGDPSVTTDYGSDLADSGTNGHANYCILQAYYAGQNDITATDAGLANINNPKGPDNVWGTKDDGLSITVQSPAFKNGGNGTINYDITGAVRNLATGFDIGAYEISPCGQITGRVIYVDSTATGTGSGSSWANAFTSLQAAVTLVYLGCADTIKVAAGTYSPSAYLRGSTDDQSGYGYAFQLRSDMAIIGGYPNGGSSTTDPSTHKAILSNSFGRVLFAGNVSNILLRGLYIENGNVNGSSTDVFTVNGISYPLADGGGLAVHNGSVTIDHCHFTGNTAAYSGGAIRIGNSKVKIDSCYFDANRAFNEGGAVFIDVTDTASAITNCIFTNNTSNYYGGGLAVANAPAGLSITNSRFTGNKTTYTGGNIIGGGALESRDATVLTINKCIFDSNASFEGGALNFNGNSRNNILNSYFLNNTSSRDGGAICNEGIAAYLFNCIFSANSAAGTGGALFLDDNTNIEFSTLIHNTAATSGGAIQAIPGSVVLNSIFWANSVAGDTLAATANVTGISTSNCSIGLNPNFVNINNILGPDGILGTTDDGLKLPLESPLVNQGQGGYDTTFYNKDITGGPRNLSGAPDLGPYEIDFCGLSAFVNNTIYVDSSAVAGNRTGRDWANAFTDFQIALNAYGRGCGIDTIKVAKGTYHPSVGSGFSIPNDITLLGGYPAGGGVRDYRHNETILSGGDHVISITNLTHEIIDGFTLKDGQAGNSHGGGVYADNSVIDVRNTIFKNNSENGAYFNNCTGKVTNCIFANNQTYFGGGGVYNSGSSVEYDNCLFYKNTADGAWGGGVFINNTSIAVPSFHNSTFYGNNASWGGGIFSGVPPSVSNCLFWNNYSSNRSPDSTAYDIYEGTVNPQKLAFSLLQYKPTNSPQGTHCIYAVTPAFADSTNPKGPDNTWGTTDDGLRQTGSSYAINNGSNDSIPAGLVTDITGATRINSGVVDIGAYEYDCGFSNFTNSLVPIGSAEVVSDTFNTCGTWQFMSSTTDPSKYIIDVDPNGNANFSPVQIKIDVTNTQLHIATDGSGDTTALAYRMVSIDAPGQYPVNGGIKIRIYYDPAELDTLPGAIHYWFKHTAHDKSTVLTDLSSDTLLNEVPILPSSYGIINGIHYVEFDSLTSFSTFGYLGATRNGALPLQFLSFTAQWSAMDKVVLLNWVTAEESNVKSFEVERSVNGNVWYKQDGLSASQSPAQSHSYNWIDTHPLPGLSYYRIKQIDNDGRSTFSIIRKVDISNETSAFEILPNPAKNIATIKLAHLTPVINYAVTDATGRTIQKGVFYNTNTISISLINQATGIYYVTINNKTQKLAVSK